MLRRFLVPWPGSNLAPISIYHSLFLSYLSLGEVYLRVTAQQCESFEKSYMWRSRAVSSLRITALDRSREPR